MRDFVGLVEMGADTEAETGGLPDDEAVGSEDVVREVDVDDKPREGNAEAEAVRVGVVGHTPNRAWHPVSQ